MWKHVSFLKKKVEKMAMSYTEAVKLWQAVLGITVDGQFGPNTLAATKRWQSAHGITPDGIVGQQTWNQAPAVDASKGDLPVLKAAVAKPKAPVAPSPSPVTPLMIYL
jgi:murein L,D-transpeptidase YcbB/YkuD